ncbi:MAG: LTA synthase family protein [Xanthomonadales bacterium]|nr:LTA synthase family protein [Xanthomonadales bacterium]
MSRPLFFLLVLATLGLVLSQLLFYQLGGYENATLSVRAIATNHLLAEFLIFTGILVLLVNGGLLLRVLAYALFILFMLVCGAQYVAQLLTSDFLTPTAIDNIRHIGLVLSPMKVTLAGSVVAGLLLVTILAERYFSRAGKLTVALIMSGCFLLGALLMLDAQWLSAETRTQRAKMYYSNVNLGSPTAPVEALVRSLGRLRQTHHQNKPLTGPELQELADFGIVYSAGKEYPLVKDHFYQSTLPFAEKTGQAASTGPMNVILFLSEGISARVIQPYNDQYPGLTPNIAEFARSAMRVDNYYNHTFATYRGLLGQMCSIFPVYAGGQVSEGTDYYCLGNLFNQEAYETYFLFSQQKARTKLDEVLAKTNVTHILAQEELSARFLNGEAGQRDLALSDQQFMRATIAQLQALEAGQAAGDTTPFFLGFYNIETHAYYHAADDGVSYPGHDSYILDSIHNYDDTFGKFWAYFRQSGLYRNTIVVFTSDHAHFQGRDFVGLVSNQPDYKPYFVDKIPLLVYHPGLELPSEYDASHASSIDLAPTITHLMGLENRPNAFIGRSIFERATDQGLAFGEGHVFLIGKDGIRVQGEYIVEPQKDFDLNLMYKVMNNINTLEKQGRIWDGQHAK